MNTVEAKRILNANKDIKELWLTDDGQMFFTENAAQNHARSLGNKELEKVSVGVKEPKEPGEPKGIQLKTPLKKVKNATSGS